MLCINPTGFRGEGKHVPGWTKRQLWILWGVAGIQPCQPRTRRHSSWTHILTSLLQTICPADSSCATPPLQPAEIFFLGGENPQASMLPSPGHSINKTTWKDAKCRIPLKLISASSSATLSCPRFLAEEARSNVATHFFPKDKRLRPFVALLPQQGKGKEREHWDQQLRSQALAWLPPKA